MVYATITGSIYDAATGVKRTQGRLHIKPRSFIVSGTDLVSAGEVIVDVPASGDLSFQLAASNGTLYDVEFDPDPASTLPRALKPGYFKNTWNVPSGAVSLSSL